MRHPSDFPGWQRAVDDPFEQHASRHRANGHNEIVASIMAAQDVANGAPPPLPLDGITVAPDRVRLRAIDGGLARRHRGAA